VLITFFIGTFLQLFQQIQNQKSNAVFLTLILKFCEEIFFWCEGCARTLFRYCAVVIAAEKMGSKRNVALRADSLRIIKKNWQKRLKMLRAEENKMAIQATAFSAYSGEFWNLTWELVAYDMSMEHIGLRLLKANDTGHPHLPGRPWDQENDLLSDQEAISKWQLWCSVSIGIATSKQQHFTLEVTRHQNAGHDSPHVITCYFPAKSPAVLCLYIQQL
jgi:hypothetical protein